MAACITGYAGIRSRIVNNNVYFSIQYFICISVCRGLFHNMLKVDAELLITAPVVTCSDVVCIIMLQGLMLLVV